MVEAMPSAVYDMLVEYITPLYSASNIFQAQQNNYTLPKANSFILITQLDSSILGHPDFGYNSLDETTTLVGYQATWFQVDFYGENSFTACNKFKLLLESSYATTFLSDLNFSIYDVNDFSNLTNIFDSDKYLKRYTIKFRMFNNNRLDINDTGFSSVNLDLVLFPNGVENG